jgi:signal transduction histidine kinase
MFFDMTLEIKDLKQVNDLVERFIYSCSHELKSPIASMQGLLEIMKYHPLHSETSKCIDMMEVCTQRMSKLMQTLEEYMINAKREVHLENVRGQALITGVLDQFHSTLEKQNVQIKTVVRQTSSWVTDARRINLVLSNLVANALTFQDPEKKEKKVLIRLNVGSRKSLLEVADNGIGIPKNMQSKVFDLFYRGHDQSQGPGLGLFLVQNIASTLKSTVSIHSTEKVGTSFKLISPNYQLK